MTNSHPPDPTLDEFLEFLNDYDDQLRPIEPNPYEKQVQQLEFDADVLLQQIQLNAYQLLIHLQQQKRELYADPTPENWQRLYQLDTWINVLLERFKAEQVQWFLHLSQTRHLLRSQINLPFPIPSIPPSPSELSINRQPG